MESIIASHHHQEIIEKILQDESKMFDRLDIKAIPERIQLGFFFFNLLKNFNLDTKNNEFTFRLYDSLMDIDQFNPSFKLVFMLSLINISLKLFETTKKRQEIMSEVIELLSNSNFKIDDANIDKDFILTESNLKITIEDVNWAEIFLLNKLDWKFNVLFISDYIQFFLNTYFNGLENFINKERFYSIIDLLTESAINGLNTKNISLHSLAICILLITFDQLRLSIKLNQKVQPFILNFLKICYLKFSIDLNRIENYKKLLLEFTELINFKLIKVYPDENIRQILFQTTHSDFNCINLNRKMKCLIWNNRKNLLNKLIKNKDKKRRITLQNKKEYKDEKDENRIKETVKIKKIKSITMLNQMSSKFMEDQL